jgi:quercetin dioxygenase-like cupin family protein
MAGLAKKSFDSADEVRTPDKTRVELVKLGSSSAARVTLQPGWRWSDCVKPVVGTETCQARHVGTVSSGQLHVHHDDGSEFEVGPGDAYVIEPGHDAWVVGSQPFVGYEFESHTAETFGR